MREILLLLLSGVLADNIVCFRCIGIGDGVLSTDTLRRSATLGTLITAASLVSTAVIYPMTLLLRLINAEFFGTALLIAVCAAAVFAGKKLFPRIIESFTSAQGAVTFGTVMGISIISSQAGSYLLSLLSAVFYGAGLLLVLCLFFCARLSVRHSRVPRSLQGLPLDLIITAIIALVVYGWHGVA